MRTTRWLRSAAFGTWAACGLPALVAIARRLVPASVAFAWSTSFAVYGAALIGALRVRQSAPRAAIGLVAIQSVTAVAMTTLAGLYIDRTGVGLLSGIGLMVIVAAQLPHVLGLRAVAAWIAVQTLAMSLLIAGGVPTADVVTFGLGSAGFQMFACMTTSLMLREAAARGDLARANAELHATRALLAEHSRVGERLRISRDLHDTIGHHLTALSLQLDVAARVTKGSAADHVGQAHAIARLLLAEVRSVVGQLREASRSDLAVAVRTLATAVDGIRIHVDIPEHLTLDDPAQAESLLRCVQEIITNSSRHSDARNLWIVIRPDVGGLQLFARDDGRGVSVLQFGNGLKGMRERFAEYSGRIEFAATAGDGFRVKGFMPTAQAAT